MDLICVARAADILGMDKSNVRRMVREGRFPGAVRRRIELQRFPVWFVPLRAILEYAKILDAGRRGGNYPSSAYYKKARIDFMNSRTDIPPQKTVAD